MDLAVAALIGAEFTAIVTSLTSGIVKPVAQSRDRQAEFRLPDTVDLLSAYRSGNVLLPLTASAEPDEDPKPLNLP